MAIRQSDFDFEGLRVHCYEGGSGFPILMLHGSGPGASTVGNFHLVLEPLAERYHILALDLIGFGLSGQKLAEPFFDMDLWSRQTRAALGRLGDGPYGVIGHSLSGALALRLARAEPRVRKVMTTGAIGRSFALNRYLEAGWTFPETKDDLRRVASSIVYDGSLITDEFLETRMKVLHSNNYAHYFRRMFAGDKQRFIDDAAIRDSDLAALDCDVLMLHGRDDLPVPVDLTSLPMSREISKADVMLIARCSHSIALEHPNKFLAAAGVLFG
jgi:2-hydroxymuconate-semialdehyde hydrolase